MDPIRSAKCRLGQLVEELGGAPVVAEEIGYTIDAVRGWVARRSGPSFDALLRLRALGVDVNWLLDGQSHSKRTKHTRSK